MDRNWGSADFQLQGVHVLVAEDSADVRDMLSALFEAFGARVTAVESETEALAAIRVARPDVLVSDITLEASDGYSLVEELRTWAPDEGGDTPAIAISGWCAESDRSRALEAGFQALLAKPVAVETLLDLVVRLTRVPASVRPSGRDARPQELRQ